MFSKERGIHFKEYRNKDSKTNVVLIHGSGTNYRLLDPLAKTLKDYYNCYVIDLPGHNKSDNLNCNDIEHYIEAVGNFIKNKFNDNVAVIGHSLGGTVAMGVSALNLPQISKAIVLNSSAKYDKLDKEFMSNIKNGKLDINYLLKACVDKLSLKKILPFLRIEPKETIINDFIINEELDITDKLDDIKIPTLVMTGSNEILAPVSYSKVLNEKIEDSILYVVPGEKHLMPYFEKEYVSGLITAFIDGTLKK